MRKKILFLPLLLLLGTNSSFTMNKNEEARIFLEKAGIWEHKLENYCETAQEIVKMWNLAVIRMHAGKIKSALELFKETANQTRLPKIRFKSLYALAHYCADIKRDEGLPYIKQILEDKKEFYCCNSHLAHIYMLAGDIFVDLKEHDTAARHYRKARTFYKKAINHNRYILSDFPDLIDCYYQIGNYNIILALAASLKNDEKESIKRTAKAEKYCNKVLHYCKKHPEFCDACLTTKASTLATLCKAELLKKSPKTQELFKLFNEAIKVYHEVIKKNEKNDEKRERFCKKLAEILENKYCIIRDLKQRLKNSEKKQALAELKTELKKLKAQNSKKRRCKNCTNEGKLVCSACKSVFYCSKECQIQDWKFHTVFCKSFYQKLGTK